MKIGIKGLVNIQNRVDSCLNGINGLMLRIRNLINIGESIMVIISGRLIMGIRRICNLKTSLKMRIN